MNEEQLKINISKKAIELISSSSSFSFGDYTNIFKSNTNINVSYNASSSINKDLQSNNSTPQNFDSAHYIQRKTGIPASEVIPLVKLEYILQNGKEWNKNKISW